MQPAEIRSWQPVLDAIRPGRKFAFRLLANATQDSRPARTKGATVRVAHRTADKQIAWLIPPLATAHPMSHPHLFPA